jgi:5-(carboxyamino)imidazole ribonucleotide synthase
MHIAIFGCGQLAQMTARAGSKLGFVFTFIAEDGEDTRCVDHLGDVVVLTKNKSAETLFEELNRPAVITVEKEMVDAKLLENLQKLTQVYPRENAIRVAQNRIREKNYLRYLSIPTADFEVIESIGQLEKLSEEFGFPIYIKSAESGYDGYNQWRLKSKSDIQQESLQQAIEEGVELIAEKHVPYHREVSVIAARNSDGINVFYPIMENRHEDGVLIATQVPASNLDEEHSRKAIQYMSKLLNEMDYVGVLTMECFETEDGIVVNELAPRVHNSGHWTIEGSSTSQFENHCRAIAGMELGPASVKGVAGIVNMLGKHGDRQQLSGDGMFYHSYGKTERPRRKLGHVTVVDNDEQALKQKLNDIMHALYGNDYKSL